MIKKQDYPLRGPRYAKEHATEGNVAFEPAYATLEFTVWRSSTLVFS